MTKLIVRPVSTEGCEDFDDIDERMRSFSMEGKSLEKKLAHFPDPLKHCIGFQSADQMQIETSQRAQSAIFTHEKSERGNKPRTTISALENRYGQTASS
jgi:hypothetical protein